MDGGFGDVKEKTWAAATASANVLNSPIGVTCVKCQLRAVIFDLSDGHNLHCQVSQWYLP